MRGLQNPSGSGRIAAAWYSSTSFTINVNLTDGQAHDIALYAVDWDSHGRSEKIQITNASTGAVLDTETLSSFVNGIYEVWTISGDVKITISRLAGSNALLNGLFFDPYSLSPASRRSIVAVGRATATQDLGTNGFGTLMSTAIRTVNSSSDTTAAPPPGDISTTSRELVHDLALGEVMVGRHRIRSLFEAILQSVWADSGLTSDLW